PSQPSGEAKRRALTAELLEGIWAQLLGMSEVPPGAGFFDLGGDSLSATRVVARVREVFGVELPLPRVFEAPGVDELAEEVERLRAELEGEALAPIRAGDPAERSSPLSSQQWRLWFFDQLHPGSPAYNIPAVVKLVGKLVPEALTAALAGLLERHRVLSTGFLEVASEPRAQWLPGLRLVAPLIDLSGLAELDRSAQAAALTEREVARPFELSRPPLLRCRLVRLGEREHRGLLSLHHIAGDGWSMSVLIRELGSLYTARLEGRQASPGALPVQYGDYARWQREQIESGRFQAQLEAWRRELAGLEELRLPGELGSSPAGDLAAESIPVRLPLGEWQRLREHCRAQGVTPFMLLVAAFSLLLYRHTGQRDQAIATAVANRDRAEIEPLIGFFVNTLILRCRLDGLMPFPAFLAEVRRTTLAAFGRQDTPFEAVVEAVAQDRGPEAPLARAVFVFQNALEGSLQMPGLELEVLSPGRHWARMDLELHLRPVPQGLVGALVYRRAVVSAATAA
nr:condensation domain-containing protein [Thermoanaerobaculia bacterium]